MAFAKVVSDTKIAQTKDALISLWLTCLQRPLPTEVNPEVNEEMKANVRLEAVSANRFNISNIEYSHTEICYETTITHKGSIDYRYSVTGLVTSDNRSSAIASATFIPSMPADNMPPA
jgi:hypothetical protein